VKHGAPLRLLVPVKLRLKNIKAITKTARLGAGLTVVWMTAVVLSHISSWDMAGSLSMLPW